MSSVLSALIVLVSSLHQQLYNPRFPEILRLSSETSTLPSTMTLSVASSQQPAPPAILAEGALVVDASSAEVLFERNADRRLFPASTTKIMSALVVLEHFSLDAQIPITTIPPTDGSKMGLVSGETLTVKDLLYGLLIESANDAAIVLAASYPGGEEDFVGRMNEKADELSLTNTHFTNPIGYSHPGHVTSVRDLVVLSRFAMQNPVFASIVSQQSLTITSADGRFSHRVRNTNELLGKFPGIEGIKTGWTQESGECFVMQASRGNTRILVAVLNSPDRFQEASALADWAFAAYSTETKSIDDWLTQSR